MEEITMKKLRAGIVGCGGIANAKHLPAMEKCGLYEVVAFCDIIPEQAQETNCLLYTSPSPRDTR